jgi:S-DNA-T family DNA segregation ATPase FtsK/SpoIIIE
MAYQTRQRDPLLDSTMQAMIERRGREVIGIALVVVGVALWLALMSYNSEDPSWMAATDVIPQNYLGQFGASVSAIFMLILGWGSYAICLTAIAWGIRLTLHQGIERALGRLIFLPIMVALASIYAASHVPPADWTHSFGLGGLFGDTVLGASLNFLPGNSHVGLKLIAVLSFFGFIGLGLFVLGTTGRELRRLVQFMLVGFLTALGTMAVLVGQSGRGVGDFARSVQSRQRARAEARSMEMESAEVQAEYGAPRVEPVRTRFLDKVPLLRSRDPLTPLEPELVRRQSAMLADIQAPSDDRIREKIADVIQNRVRRPVVATDPVAAGAPVSGRVEPRLTAQRIEPPLTTSNYAEAEDLVPDLIEEDFDLPDYDTIPIPHSERSTDFATEPSRAAAFVAPVTEPRRVVQYTLKRPTVPSRKAMAEAQPSLPLEDTKVAYDYPPLSLLEHPVAVDRQHLSDEALEENARMLESVLDDYGVKGEIVSVRPGPVVTMYELEPAPGLKASRVIGLADDIARSMSALSARVSTVPGRSVIGIELPNVVREKVVLREILGSRDFGDGNHRLPLALGKDIAGDPVVANLAKMPHLLIAGTTGSGKSVAINTMILSLLYKLSPEECRMIMIDPKMLELSVYDGIPHLLSPVVTDPKKAVVALKWVVGEMEERYRKMSKMGVRNIDGYNSRVKDALSKGQLFSRTVQTGFDDNTGEPVFETEEFAPVSMPYIVVIVDEMADLMMVAGKEIEACIQRLAQMARASGIHIIMATQRPSVDVITGTIKANFPTRISFHVTSKIDSRTILGEQGAEQLLGMGDMLYMAGGAKITRIHGPFVSDEEVEEIVTHLKSFGPPDYTASVLDGPDDDRESDIDLVLGLGGNTDGEDALYDQAVAIVIKDRKCSTSYIQRKLAIGYNKAARLVEQMEDTGLVSAANHVGKREILIPEQA